MLKRVRNGTTTEKDYKNLVYFAGLTVFLGILVGKFLF